MNRPPSIVWRTPMPLWTSGAQGGTRRRPQRPTLLRFTNDRFVQTVQQTLATDPARLSTFVVQSGAGDPDSLVTLYQPVHGRFYFVTASLVCRVPGFPDKGVDTIRGERIGFVVRRLVPQAQPCESTTYDEYGWMLETMNWFRLDDPDQVDDREERLPLIPFLYGTNGTSRRLPIGFVPVARRPDYNPDLNDTDGFVYVMRCVYERPRCASSVVSAPSQPFRMAAFQENP